MRLPVGGHYSEGSETPTPPRPTATSAPGSPAAAAGRAGSPVIFWLVAVLLLVALGATLFALRLLTIRVRQVRTFDDEDEPGGPQPPG